MLVCCIGFIVLSFVKVGFYVFFLICVDHLRASADPQRGICNVKVNLLMMSHPVLPVCLVYLPAYLVLILLFHLSCSVVPYG